jgi:hypothetical protein
MTGEDKPGEVAARFKESIETKGEPENVPLQNFL